MARKNSPTILQEELYPPPGDAVREEMDDSRLLDLDVDEESPFLRGQKRVPARRGPLPKKTATRLSWVAVGLSVLLLCAIAGSFLYRYGKHSWRFRIESSDNIEIAGLHNVARSQVMEVMGGEIGRNIFFVSLAERKAQLEQIPWVESASVMRFVPNRLKIEIHERSPVAFARVGSKILLIDSGGSLMELPAGNKTRFSFPVILGTSAGEPLSTRSERMKIYNELVRQLDSGGARHSQEISEVDLSDPDDVKVLVSDPEGAVLVHLGSSNFAERYKVYVSHVQEWRQQFDKLESVDLRYDRQVIVNPDLRGAVKQPPLTVDTAKAAMAAGVKPAALVVKGGWRPPAKASTPSVPASKPASRKTVKKGAVRKPAVRPKPIAKKAQPKSSPHVVQAAKRDPLPSASSTSRKPSPSIAKESN